ncbi:MAG: hypothetical protein Unbinned5081contig1003_43 [Prokaryotic dsDNA virus sp.]|nr:MAG: hypothetical protein Unbinned5081contig1003_43 [Prokaryotic dsDNA virus sp.]
MEPDLEFYIDELKDAVKLLEKYAKHEKKLQEHDSDICEHFSHYVRNQVRQVVNKLKRDYGDK